MNCTGTTSDIVHYCPLPYPSISPFQVPVKALRTPLNTSHRLSGVDLRVELDAGRVGLQLAGLGERLYRFEVFLEEIGGRGVKGPGQFAERDSVQVQCAGASGAASIWAIVLSSLHRRLVRTAREQARDSIWGANVRSRLSLGDRGPVPHLIAGSKKPCMCQVAVFSPAR
jgi:hypothetical protein